MFGSLHTLKAQKWLSQTTFAKSIIVFYVKDGHWRQTGGQWENNPIEGENGAHLESHNHTC